MGGVFLPEIFPEEMGFSYIKKSQQGKGAKFLYLFEIQAKNFPSEKFQGREIRKNFQHLM
jgi:hypothetical protein